MVLQQAVHPGGPVCGPSIMGAMLGSVDHNQIATMIKYPAENVSITNLHFESGLLQAGQENLSCEHIT